VDARGVRTMLKGEPRETLLNRRNVLWTAVSFTMFLRRRVVDVVGSFDESLGPGAGTPWGAGEETDYCIRALKKGLRLLFTPEVQVVHPEAAPNPQRAFSYGLGNGRVLRMRYSPWFCLWYGTLRPLAGVALDVLRGDLTAARLRLIGTVARTRAWMLGI
jgi:GT2 family glycosyltransferase